MRHVAQSELEETLEETKERLRELERLKLIGPEDLEILSTKRALKRKVSELEERQAADTQGKRGRGKP